MSRNFVFDLFFSENQKQNKQIPENQLLIQKIFYSKIIYFIISENRQITYCDTLVQVV